MISIWWSTRLRRAAAPLVIEDVGAEELREAVESGRAALAEISDARAAIIACYVAMERSLAERGTSARRGRHPGRAARPGGRAREPSGARPPAG